jgi:undecaprenyl diphosphate synthase
LLKIGKLTKICKPLAIKDNELEVKKSTQNELSSQLSDNKLPLQHVAIIMDGNRRWADSRKLPRLLGHREGVKSLKRLVKHVGKLGLPYLTVYAFSSENWQRSQEEVDYLFELFALVIKEELRELNDSNVKLSFIGQLEKMPIHLKESFDMATLKTSNNTGLRLQIAINYGSRLEISEAIKKIVNDIEAGALAASDIDENLIEKYLYTKGLPDPEMIIRTGGEMRLSNYLLWQAAYAEFYVTAVLWPEFTPVCFDAAIAEFKQRVRRFGGD